MVFFYYYFAAKMSNSFFIIQVRKLLNGLTLKIHNQPNTPKTSQDQKIHSKPAETNRNSTQTDKTASKQLKSPLYNITQTRSISKRAE